MRRAKALVVFFFFAVGVFAGDEPDDDDPSDGEEQDYVHVLTKDNFEKKLKANERVLVEFYLPEDSRCKALKEEYSKASKFLKAEQLDTIVAKVDVSEQEDLARQFGVEGKVLREKLPVLKYFIKGEFIKDFDGKRDADGITLWLKNKERPPVTILKKDGVQQFFDDTDDTDFAVVAYIKKKSARQKAYFKAVEDTLAEWDVSKLRFGAVWLPKDADPKADASMSMWRPGFDENIDPQTINFTGSWTESTITKWAQQSTYATIGQDFSRGKYAPQQMDHMGWTAAIVAVLDDGTVREDEESPSEANKPKVIEALVPLARENPEWRFAVADVEKLEDHEQELLGVAYGGEPRITFMGNAAQFDKKKYQLVGSEEITDTDQIREFLDKAKAKKLKPYYKSAAAPERDIDEEGVTIVTGNTFEEYVFDEDKDVFVEFYAPWCGHCKQLAPEWKKLAEKGIRAGWHDNNVVIAKMDAAANDSPETIEGFPKLVLYPAVPAEKKMRAKQVYSGPREAEPMFEFVTSAAKNLEEDDEEEEKSAKPKKKSRKDTSPNEEEDL